MLRDHRERHSKKDGAWVSSWMREEWKDERWPGSLFQTLEATDENDLDFSNIYDMKP